MSVGTSTGCLRYLRPTISGQAREGIDPNGCKHTRLDEGALGLLCVACPRPGLTAVRGAYLF